MIMVGGEGILYCKDNHSTEVTNKLVTCSAEIKESMTRHKERDKEQNTNMEGGGGRGERVGTKN